MMLNISQIKTYIINLPHRIDRRLNIINELHTLGITNYTFIDGVYNNIGWIGCFDGHKKCIQKAKDNNDDIVLILEDDAIFTQNALEEIKIVLSQLPEIDWDMLFWGVTLCGGVPIPVTTSIYKLTDAYAAHAYLVHNKMYDTILNLQPVKEIDVHYCELMKSKNIYMCNPMIAYQLPSHSDIQGRQQNHNWMMRDLFNEKMWQYFDSIDDISVLIGTCDSYSYLWKNFDVLFKRYWKINTKNYFVCENNVVPYNGYESILCGNKSWGERILLALQQITTKYVFFILEDYYFIEEIDSKLIRKYINMLEQHQAQKIMIEHMDEAYKVNRINDNLYLFDMSSDYLNSIQPSIWETEYLKNVLKPQYSPWDFEVIGNEYTATLTPKILLYPRSKRIYFNLVRKGGILSDGWQKLFEKENLS